MKHIIIYGDLWADSRAVIAIIQNRYAGINTMLCSNMTELVGFLSRYPDAGLVLCLRPHEHVFLFYHLQPWLASRRVLIVVDRLYFTDQCVMQYFRLTDFLQRDRLTPLIQPGRHLSDEPDAWHRFWKMDGVTCRFPGEVVGSETLLLTLKQYMWQQLPVSVSVEKYALLVLLSTGLSSTSVARRWRLSANAVSLYWRQAMKGLDMPPSRVALYRGVCLRDELQRTAISLSDNFF
ncbi:transcriptional regulator [Salmonella bongori]|uniref:hypothetical protein n=1 Tax=Salmonella bongori TaxID=54736 RepID=UPI0009A9B3F8|nr:hypothetical protein [Salmonella bongori]EGE4653827.1 transcriptional regulator [Salmonella bongori serovar 40:z35:- str. 95-0123]EGE4658655.1 transcriptional regulator [Salmonella bongori serovar 48:i:- str. 94-0708]ECC8921169.1 transcriptional regulator [Salmonella bongori]ECC9594761.1 transcriptional regulator [Salmonella bongori]ECG1192371.1 transcriptional regulator [Salmonella bongori]